MTSTPSRVRLASQACTTWAGRPSTYAPLPSGLWTLPNLVATITPLRLPLSAHPAVGETRGRHRGRQVRHARVAGPEELVGCGHAVAVDLYGALPALGLLVVGKGRRRRRRAEQQVVLLEELGPLPAHLVPRLV